MRYIFVDEAGKSAEEPITVVVGVIAHADQHIMAAEAAIEEILAGVPSSMREGFIFHAMQVFGDMNIRDGWSQSDRLHLLKQMMSVPRRLGMAITLSLKWRSGEEDNLYKEFGLRPEHSDHLFAFEQCLAVSDRNIRDHAGIREVATVVAENVDELRKHMRHVPTVLRNAQILMAPEYIRKTDDDVAAGYQSQRGDLRITRIRKAVHFVEKADDPLIQLADACAYGFRRYFCKQSFGEDFARAIVADIGLLKDFESPGGVVCFWPRHLKDAGLM